MRSVHWYEFHSARGVSQTPALARLETASLVEAFTGFRCSIVDKYITVFGLDVHLACAYSAALILACNRLNSITIVKFHLVQNQDGSSLTNDTILTSRPLRLLRMLYETGKSITIYTLRVKQSDLAARLGISRQALNVHLRKLRDQGYIRTGRGFIDVTEKGLNLLGISANPAFVFLKISPLKRNKAYDKIFQFPIQRVYRIAGDMDAILVIEREKVDEALKMLASVDGVLDTRTYIAIQTLK